MATDSQGPDGSVPPPVPPVEEARSLRPTPWAGWRPQDAMIGLGFVVLGLVLTGSVVFGFISREPDRTLVALVIQDIIFVAVPLGLAAQRNRSRPGDVAGFTAFRSRDLWLVAGAMAAQFVVTVLFSLFIFTPEQDSVVEDMGFDNTTLAAVAAFATIVVLAPIGEEALFRGLFFGAIRSRAPFWVAASVSSLLFGLVHLTTSNPAAAILLAFFGLLLAWLYEKTGSLGPPIALHMVNNAIAIIPLIF